MDRNSRYDNALRWIREHAGEDMDNAELLSERFPHGPAPAGDKMIDVIAVNDTSGSSVLYRSI